MLQIQRLSVSKDFNAKLLNRVANERFLETRTKAYLPKHAPHVRWKQVIPAFVTTAAFAIVTFMSFWPGTQSDASKSLRVGLGNDDSYLTVQPSQSRSGVDVLDQDWSLSEVIARAEKLSKLSNNLIQPEVQHLGQQASGHFVGGTEQLMAPFASGTLRIRPMYRVYVAPVTQATSVKEGQGTY
jgi:hypothetical protein